MLGVCVIFKQDGKFISFLWDVQTLLEFLKFFLKHTQVALYNRLEQKIPFSRWTPHLKFLKRPALELAKQ